MRAAPKLILPKSTLPSYAHIGLVVGKACGHPQDRAHRGKGSESALTEEQPRRRQIRITVTGSAGYLGSVLVPALLTAGHEVIAVDLFPNGARPLASSLHDKRLKLVRADVCDINQVSRSYQEADLIIPLAAIVGAPACDRNPIMARAVNQYAVNSPLLIHARGKPIIFPTTNSGYGVGGEELCTEETPLRPVSLYGLTKAEAERCVLEAGGVSLRLATVFGQSPSFRPELLVNQMVYRAVYDKAVVIYEGHHRRNFIHVRDVAKAFLHVIDNYETMAGGVFNVGLDEANMTKNALCERIRRQVPGFTFLAAPIGVDPDQRNYIVSSQKLMATGWKPDCSLDDGIAELIRSYV